MAESHNFLTLLTWTCAAATTACTFSTSGQHLDIHKSPEQVVINLNLLTQNVLRKITMCTFSTSQLPKVLQNCGALYIFTMRFAPQPRALFRQLNFQECSETDVLCHFLLENVLRATRACNCSCLIYPDISAPAALALLRSDFLHVRVSCCLCFFLAVLFHLSILWEV